MADKQKQNITQVVKDYGKRLFSFIRGKVKTDEDAEDILQDVWYQLSNLSATETIEQISGWLFTVARNKIYDKYRKQKPELLSDFNFEDDEDDLYFPEFLFADNTTAESEELKNLFWEELFAALEELPETQRQVFMLNELEDKTLQQIADETGENLKTIISRKRYAVKHLRERLEFLYNEFINF